VNFCPRNDWSFALSGPFLKCCLFFLLEFCLIGTTYRARAQEIRVVSRYKGETLGYLTAIEVGRYKFISIDQFSQVLSIPFTYDKIQKQITLYTSEPITLTAINPFILIGKKIYQLPMKVLYRKDEFFVPLEFFLQCIVYATPYHLEYNESRNELSVLSTSVNISGVSVEERENGVILRLATTAIFRSADIFTSESNGWFYVDLYGGKVDTTGTLTIDNQSRQVTDIIPLQLSRETARVSFRIPRTLLEKNIYVSEDPSEIIASLRTKEKISNDILSELAREREKWKIDVIVIDPGHGGQDPGAIGRSGLCEKNITLAIAKGVREELERQLDVKVIMTRNDDRFIPLKKRTQIANQNGGKLFISIHVDSNPARSLRGHTVYFMGPAKTEQARKSAQLENSVIRFEDETSDYENLSDASFILAANAQNSYNKESQAFAAIMDREIKKNAKSRSIGVRQAGFYVLYGASMPNILIEIGFISNRYDEQNLSSRSYLSEIARAICNSIIEFKTRYETS
jgi:N-acetylmuramoyl-L-alanine amidase